MFDTHAIARSLTAADLTDAQADAITDAVREAAEHDAAVDVDALATKADLARFATKEELRAELAALEARLARRLVGAGVAIAGIAGDCPSCRPSARRLVGAGVAIAGIQAAALFALLRTVGPGG